jgi:hypothetical protein
MDGAFSFFASTFSAVAIIVSFRPLEGDSVLTQTLLHKMHAAVKRSVISLFEYLPRPWCTSIAAAIRANYEQAGTRVKPLN